MSRKVVHANRIIGQVVMMGVKQPETCKVKVNLMKLDKYVVKYFNWHLHAWCQNDNVRANVGDIVLIKKLHDLTSVNVQYEVEDMIFELGRTVDPMTGRRCRGKEFLTDEDKRMELKISENKSAVS